MWITIEKNTNQLRCVHWEKSWSEERVKEGEQVVEAKIVSEQEAVWWVIVRKDNKHPLFVYNDLEKAKETALLNDVLYQPIAPICPIEVSNEGIHTNEDIMGSYWIKWLKQEGEPDNAYLESLVNVCQQNLQTEDFPVDEYAEFAACIESIVKACWEYFGTLSFDLEETQKNCTTKCWELMVNFDSKRTKAINYFTAIILEELRQMYQKNAKEQS